MDKAYNRVLFLILTEYWFDKIKSGEKTHEYREARDYWNIRLAGKRFDHVCFRRGYKSKEKMIFKIKSIQRKQNIPNDLNLPDVWDIELGAVQSTDKTALDAFVKKYTGIDSVQWITPEQQSRIIEILKQWLKRIGD